jgi:pyrroline-5-carboxylate reductase
MKIAFIGGGNMAAALISGLGRTRPQSGWIRVSEPSEQARQALTTEYGVECHDHARPVVSDAEIIVLAVKPQVMPAVLNELSGLIQAKQLVLSIAAGIPVCAISAALENRPPVVRAMPNTPALIGKGVSGAFAGPGCSARQRELGEVVLRAAGDCVWIEDEALMDVVTAVSGSGPAYFFLLIEALRDAGEALGLPGKIATRLALQTAAGAGAMAVESALDVSELRKRVTSPGGTTQAALEAFAEGGFRELVAEGVRAATRRGRELAQQGDSS